jgi:tripartite-type tricarboxylate transporter receptor subunit TctC
MRIVTVKINIVLTAVLALLGIASAFGQTSAYPTRPIRLLVGFGAGAPDTVARLIAPSLASALGQPVVVENRPGANGVIATEQLAKAPADGHTLLVSSTSIVVNPSIYKKLPYDLERDVAPISLICSNEAMIIGINTALPVRSLEELIAYSRKPEARLAYGSPGIGNTLHLSSELFKARTGAELLHIPYKGAGAAITALIANEVQMMYLTPPLSLPHIRSGKLRALATTSPKRASFLPEVPSVTEAGFPALVMDGGWHGLFAAAATPPEIIARLETELRKALADPTVRERIAGLGLDAVGSSSAEFRKLFAEQIRSHAEMVKLAKIQPE